MTDTENGVYNVRTMRPEDVEETYKLIDKEGWNLSLDKFSSLSKMCPDIFYVAVTKDNEIAATMSLYPTFRDEYVLGNIVVKDGHRYKGLGRKLADDVIALKPNAVVSLTAVPGADQFYIKSGFKFTEPQQGHVIFHLVLDRADLNRRAEESRCNIDVSSNDDTSLHDLVEYDQQARGYNNSRYITMQIECFKVVTTRDADRRLVGYGVAFIKREEIVLDGLYADTDDIALLIFVELMKEFPERNLMKIQIPSSRLFLSELGHIKSSYIYNRYSKGTPTLSPLSKVYNVGDCDYTY